MVSSLTGFLWNLNLILAKSLTGLRYKWWTLNWRLSVVIIHAWCDPLALATFSFPSIGKTRTRNLATSTPLATTVTRRPSGKTEWSTSASTSTKPHWCSKCRRNTKRRIYSGQQSFASPHLPGLAHFNAFFFQFLPRFYNCLQQSMET